MRPLNQRTHIEVLPRYTGGSPAMLSDIREARRIAAQEQEEYHALRTARPSHAFSPDEQRVAASAGDLSGIVFTWREEGSKIYVWDLITDETRMFKTTAAFRQWFNLQRQRGNGWTRLSIGSRADFTE